MFTSPVLSVPCLPSFVSLHLSPFMCLPEWWCPPLRSCLFPFICLPSFVSLQLSPFCNIAYDGAVRKVSLRNMMSEKLPIHTPFPRSSLQFFKPDVRAVVLAGCAGHSCGLMALITIFQNIVIVIVIAIVIVIVTVIIVICYH